MTGKKLHIGVIGMGRAFTLMLPTFLADKRVELVAGADSSPAPRAQFARDFSAPVYDTAEALCRDANVEAVYIASPHQFHAEHTVLAAANGKHVLVEKPMAIALDECTRMIEAAGAAGVCLIVGHSHSFDAPILKTRALIADGAFGRVRMIQMLNYTDFLYRARRPEELDTAQGGGVIFSQAAHQIDIARLLGGGRLKSVRALTGAWDARRPTEGAYSALLSFEGGAFATLGYSGYGHFDSDEFLGWIGELGIEKDPRRYGAARKSLAGLSREEESALKAERNYGNSKYVAPDTSNLPRRHQHFGFVLVSCDGADLRPMTNGVMVYADSKFHLDPLPEPSVPRAEVIDELYDAVIHGKPPLHDGAWARATTEASLAILESAKVGREIALHHQVSPNG